MRRLVDGVTRMWGLVTYESCHGHHPYASLDLAPAERRVRPSARPDRVRPNVFMAMEHAETATARSRSSPTWLSGKDATCDPAQGTTPSAVAHRRSTAGLPGVGVLRAYVEDSLHDGFEEVLELRKAMQRWKSSGHASVPRGAHQ